MKRVIVFGATGTVGAYTALRLKEDGIEVIGTGSRFTDGGFFAANGIEYVSLDITQAGQFLQKLPSSGIDAIVNLAGMLPARMQGYFPQAYIDINMSGMLNILEYAAKTGVSRLVYSQSISDVDYLMGTTVPVPEDSATTTTASTQLPKTPPQTFCATTAPISASDTSSSVSPTFTCTIPIPGTS